MANIPEEDIKKSVIILALDNLLRELEVILELPLETEDKEFYAYIKEAATKLIEEYGNNIPKENRISWENLSSKG